MDRHPVILSSSSDGVEVNPTRTSIGPRIANQDASPSGSATVGLICLATDSSVRRRVSDQQQETATEIPPLHFGARFEDPIIDRFGSITAAVCFQTVDDLAHFFEIADQR